jgi:hypothetical protein
MIKYADNNTVTRNKSPSSPAKSRRPDLYNSNFANSLRNKFRIE